MTTHDPYGPRPAAGPDHHWHPGPPAPPPARPASRRPGWPALFVTALAAALLGSGATVLAKGGVRLSGPDAVDVFYDGSELEVLSEPKVGEVPVSGAGCSLAAAVAAELAKGASEIDAARTAKAFVSAGIRHRLNSRLPFESLWQGGFAAES